MSDPLSSPSVNFPLPIFNHITFPFISPLPADSPFLTHMVETRILFVSRTPNSRLILQIPTWSPHFFSSALFVVIPPRAYRLSRSKSEIFVPRSSGTLPWPSFSPFVPFLRCKIGSIASWTVPLPPSFPSVLSSP